MSRKYVLNKIRTALGRWAGQSADAPLVTRLVIPQMTTEEKVAIFLQAIEKLGGQACRAFSSSEVCALAAECIGEGPAIASNSGILQEYGITALPGVQAGFKDPEELKAACNSSKVGITGTDYALADTGTLVLFSSYEEARMISLLPPIHLAIVPHERILTGLDELFSVLPQPAEVSSSMVLITGPSRTADIEQILVRGVHGPGMIYVIVV